MKAALATTVAIALAILAAYPADGQLWTPFKDESINKQVSQALHPGKNNEKTSDNQHMEYFGTATINIEYWDYDASGSLVRQNWGTYERKVTVLVSSPETCGSFAEFSPFHLTVDTDIDPVNPQDGDFSIYSGGSFSHPSGGCVMLAYWQIVGDMNSFHGTLTDTHSAEANIRNMLWTNQQIAPGVEMVSFSSIDNGATIQGTIDDQKAHIRIQGNSVSKTRPFSAEILAHKAD